jgi:imidazolonepropionase-like amidohydrolase
MLILSDNVREQETKPMLQRIALYLAVFIVLAHSGPFQFTAQGPPATIALVNGKWFNGESFEARTVYSEDGLFTFKKPAHVVRTLDLAGAWIVPPFAEAHNHNINGETEDEDRRAIRHYLADGVFYVQNQGNLPLTEAAKRRLALDHHESIDAIFAQGAQITSSTGHPALMAELIWLPQKSYPGFTKETLKDYRYFTIDSETDLDKKWPVMLGQHPDFIKTILWSSDEYQTRKDNPAYFGQSGLDPRLLPKIVARAHARNLRVSTHVTTVADFHNAVTAGVDIVAHLPSLGAAKIGLEDARLAAQRGIVVITTVAMVSHLPEQFLSKQDLAQVLASQVPNLKLLHDNGVSLAIGSDSIGDSSLREVEYIQKLGVFDNLTLLKMWTETTPKAIFPNRKIGALKEGYEASFLALEGNPIEDFHNVRRIKLRFKQGFSLEP